MLDLTGRLIVIVGGGGVAARKVAGLLEAGATQVRVVAPKINPEIPAEIERITASYDSKYLDGAMLAFAATDSPAVNERVVADARGRGILVNRADGEGDFSTPAKFQEGEVIVTVTAQSAALAVAIRNDLAHRLDPRYANMAHAMLTLRPAILNSSLTPAKRSQALRALATDEALDVLARDGSDALLDWLRKKYPELKR